MTRGRTTTLTIHLTPEERVQRRSTRAPPGSPRQQRLRRVPRFYLLYGSTSLLWWQGVIGTIGLTSSHAWRRHWRCTGRPREGWRNVHHTAIHSMLHPS